ncbi:MAG TPA: rhodanese-like domain-containing protein [Nitrospirota bacterium]|nr:rhodanese-like domain-containing protein [Nitrospirota bacterium]
MVRPRKQRKIFTGLCVFALVFVSPSFAENDVKMIGTSQLHSMVVDNVYELEAGRQGQFAIIDARPREEYERAHIFSAISIPIKDFEKLKDLLPKDREALLVVYCDDTKSETSRTWAGKATGLGYANIVVYSESFSAWRKSKMPIVPLKAAFDDLR